MARRPVVTSGAPHPLGPYSQGVLAGQWLYCAGQMGLDPATGELVDGAVGEQATRALLNIKAVLEAAGANLSAVVKTTLILANIGDFAAVNEVYGRFFVEAPPARSVIGGVSLPRGALVEIVAIACLDE